MEYNFDKIFEGVLKFLTPSNGIMKRESRYLTTTNNKKNASDVNTWDNYYDLGLIYNDLLTSKRYENWRADDLNALYTPNLFQKKKVNERGYLNWNNSFDKLGINQEYFDRDTSKFDYLGPTTWNRFAVIQNLANKHNTLESGLKTKSGILYFDTTQNKWVTAPYALLKSPIELTVSSNEKVTSPNEKITSPNEETTPSNEEIKSTNESLEYPKFRRNLYTTGIPIALQAGIGIHTALLNYAEELKKKFPLKPFLSLNYRLNNSFLLGQAAQLQAAELKDWAGLGLGSDLVANLNKLKSALQLANSILQNANLQREQIAQGDRQNLLATTNKNLMDWRDTGAINIQQRAADWNNRILAKLKLNSTLGAELENVVGRLSQDYGEKLKTDRANYIDWAKGKLAYDNDIKLLDLQKTHLLAKDWFEYDNGKFFKAYKDWVDNNIENEGWFEEVGDDADYTDEWYKRLWNRDASKAWRERWKTILDINTRKYKEDYGNALLSYKAALGMYPTYVDNQGFGLFKSGGKINGRFTDYREHFVKEQQNVRKQSLEKTKIILKSLQNELNSLDRETLLLLRQVFK